jgi:hypothetical protein
VTAASGLLQASEAGRIKGELGKAVPTSITNMDPANPFLNLLVDTPISPEVKVHSIIAVKTSGPITEGNDGVVEYKSAHISPVESEYVVPVGHSCDHRRGETDPPRAPGLGIGCDGSVEGAGGRGQAAG